MGQIIGIAGPARSGKDTTYDVLRRQLPGLTKRIRFAGPLKDFCRRVFDWTDEHVDGALKDTPDKRYQRTHAKHATTGNILGGPSTFTCDRCGVSFRPEAQVRAEVYRRADCITFLTPREAMQTLGQEWGRARYENVWVALAMREASAWADAVSAVAIITDVRYLNEAEAVRAAGGALLWIEREVDDLPGGASAHASETEAQGRTFQALVTHRVPNHGTLDELDAQVRALRAQLGL